MNKRNKLVAMAAAGTLTSPTPVHAHGSGKIHRRGISISRSPAAVKPMAGAVIQGVQELGYVKHENVAFVYRYADVMAVRLSAVETELVRRDVDLSSHIDVARSRGHAECAWPRKKAATVTRYSFAETEKKVTLRIPFPHVGCVRVVLTDFTDKKG